MYIYIFFLHLMQCILRYILEKGPFYVVHFAAMRKIVLSSEFRYILAFAPLQRASGLRRGIKRGKTGRPVKAGQCGNYELTKCLPMNKVKIGIGSALLEKLAYLWRCPLQEDCELQMSPMLQVRWEEDWGVDSGIKEENWKSGAQL